MEWGAEEGRRNHCWLGKGLVGVGIGSGCGWDRECS